MVDEIFELLGKITGFLSNYVKKQSELASTNGDAKLKARLDEASGNLAKGTVLLKRAGAILVPLEKSGKTPDEEFKT
jgi:hypothetical protein